MTVNITQFSRSSGTIFYGQNQTYGAVVTSSPLFPGPFLWQNGTQTIATLPSLSNATSSGVFLGGVVRFPSSSQKAPSDYAAMRRASGFIKIEAQAPARLHVLFLLQAQEGFPDSALELFLEIPQFSASGF